MRLEAERAPAESYFEARERQRLGGGRTSRHILSRVPAARGLWGAASGIDRSIGAHIDAVGASLGDEPTPGEAALRPLFRQWRTLLDVGMSIVLHGLGSKGALLRAFASEALPDCHVISVSGHASESSPEKAMDACADLAGGARVAFVAEDAQGVLRTPEHWSRLAALQAAGVYVVLSVEGVRGAAWAPADPLLGSDPGATWAQLRPTWHDATTMRPYVSELGPIVAKLASGAACGATGSDDEALRVAGATAVLSSLPPAGRAVFGVLAEHAIAHASGSGAGSDSEDEGGNTAVSPDNEDEEEAADVRAPPLGYVSWLRSCQAAFAVSSELAFRTQLVELVDHRVVAVAGAVPRPGDDAPASFGPGDAFVLPFSLSAVERLLSHSRG